jgi:hypothetical protein
MIMGVQRQKERTSTNSAVVSASIVLKSAEKPAEE